MTCGVLIWDRKATAKTGKVVVRACGAETNSVIKIKRDTLFAACGRHNRRLKEAGIRL